MSPTARRRSPARAPAPTRCLRTIELEVDLEVYPVEAVMLAAYALIDRCFVLLDKLDAGHLRISLSVEEKAEEDLPRLAGRLQNELLSQALRQRIGDKHQKERELLLARALFGAAPEVEQPPSLDQMLDDLAGPDLPGEDDDFIDDPLGISVPWEVKHETPAAPASGAPAPPESTLAGGPESRAQADSTAAPEPAASGATGESDPGSGAPTGSAPA